MNLIQYAHTPMKKYQDFKREEALGMRLSERFHKDKRKVKGALCALVKYYGLQFYNTRFFDFKNGGTVDPPPPLIKLFFSR